MSRPPSQEVSDSALKRAQELAQGLYPHQVEGLAFLLARRRSILADDMGLGKTRQSIIALQEAEPTGPWLVVCPASVKRNWEREIELVSGNSRSLAAVQSNADSNSKAEDAKRDSTKNAVEPAKYLANSADIVVVDRKTAVPTKNYRGWVVINYDIVKKHAAALKKLPFVGFVFDEAHYLKNHQTQRSKAARAVLESATAPMVHCLTGTPMMNRPRDLFPLLQLVDHPLGKSFLGFAKRYCDAYRGDFGWETKGASNLDELTVQLHGTMLRRTKDEVLDLPEKMRTWLTVELPGTTGRRGMQRILATLLKETSDYADESDSENSGERLPPISRAKLIARITPVRSEIAGAKIKHSVEFAKGIIDQGEKVIIYTCFQEVADTIVEGFPKEEVRLLTGSTSSDERQQAVDDFQNDDNVRVFCATVIAGGIGITLTAARTVIFNDLDWVPANHWQAEDRAYRIGQTHPVNVYYFKAANSIDEFVGKVLETKSNLINAVIEGNSLAEEELTGDVFSELERVVDQLDVETSGKLTNSQLDSAMDQAVAGYAKSAEAAVALRDPLHKPRRAEAEIIRALARAMSPVVTATKYRIPSSKPPQFYELEVAGSDVVCSCRGFDFRGQCKHARTLKDALARGDAVPEAYQRVD